MASSFYTAPFNPPCIPEHFNWQYDQLNVFNARNRKFDYYSHHYVYALIDNLNNAQFDSDY